MSATVLPRDWRINNFDLLRLLAALQVACVHMLEQLRLPGADLALLNAALRLFPGVPIFFVISGILVSKSYERADSWGSYLRNRCLRIFPAVWVCLVITVAIALLAGITTRGPASSRDWLLWWGTQMGLYQGLSLGFDLPADTGGRLNGSLWTLPVEFEFYLLIPLLYGALRLRDRRGNLALLGLLLVSLVLRSAAIGLEARHYTLILDTVAPYLWMFLVGVLIQRNWPLLQRCFIGRLHWWLLGYLLLAVLARQLHVGIGSADIHPALLLPLAGLAVAFATTMPTLSDRLLRHNDLSYGLYIYHLPVLIAVRHLGLAGTGVAAAAMAVSLTLAAASWWLVEKPFLHRKRVTLRMPLAAARELATLSPSATLQ